MTRVQKYRRGIGAFIASENGQRFFNFAYSIGAAIVIWGALFKILHLPGGNALLSIGMGTEVLMFVLTAFDRPAKQYKWEEVFPVLDSHNTDDRPDFATGTMPGGMVSGGATGGSGATGAPAVHLSTPAENLAINPDGTISVEGTTRNFVDQMAALAAEMQHLKTSTESLNHVSDVLLESYHAVTENSDSITTASKGYVEQMQALNRNLSGLNSIYELQLRSIASQLEAIDRVNSGIKAIRDAYERSAAQSASYCEEAEKMARNMQQINSVYERMITAMTINMYNPMMAPAAAAATQAPAQAPAPAPEATEE